MATQGHTKNAPLGEDDARFVYWRRGGCTGYFAEILQRATANIYPAGACGAEPAIFPSRMTDFFVQGKEAFSNDNPSQEDQKQLQAAWGQRQQPLTEFRTERDGDHLPVYFSKVETEVSAGRVPTR
jgi:hypothetical protein